jgi:hypothetical protein
MDTLWEKIKRGLQEGATTAAAKAEYLGRLGKTRLEVARSRHAIHEAFAELGGLSYEDLTQDDVALGKTSEPIKEQVAKLKSLEKALKENEEAFGAVKAGEDSQASELAEET